METRGASNAAEEVHEKHGDPEARERVQDEQDYGDGAVAAGELMRRRIYTDRYGYPVDQQQGDDVQLKSNRECFANSREYGTMIFEGVAEVEKYQSAEPFYISLWKGFVQSIHFFGLLDNIFGNRIRPHGSLHGLQFEHGGVTRRQLDQQKRDKTYSEECRNNQ